MELASDRIVYHFDIGIVDEIEWEHLIMDDKPLELNQERKCFELGCLNSKHSTQLETLVFFLLLEFGV